VTNDPAVNPSHYKGKTLEVIDILENWNLHRNGYLMQAVAYILRHHRKGTPARDLQKSCWYLDRCRSHGHNTPGTPVDSGRVYDSEAVCEDLGLPVMPFAGILDDIRYASRMRGGAWDWKLKGVAMCLREYIAKTYPPEPTLFPDYENHIVNRYSTLEQIAAELGVDVHTGAKRDDGDQLRMFGVLANQAPE
jgi:hypothetical protein